MAINLLGSMPNLTNGPVGVKAKAPAANLTGPTLTLPRNQTAPAMSTLTATQGLGSMQAANNAFANRGITGVSLGDKTIVAPPATPAAPVTNTPATAPKTNGYTGPAVPPAGAQTNVSAPGGSYTPQGTYTAPQPQVTTPAPSNPPVTFPGLLGAAAAQGGAINTQAGNINNTASQIGQYGQMTPEEQAARQQLAASVAQQGRSIGSVESHPADLNYGLGLEGVINRTAAAQQGALGQSIQGYAAERQANQAAYTGQANAQNQAGGLLGNAAGVYNTTAGQAAPILAAPGQSNYGIGGNGGGEITPDNPFYSTLQGLATALANNQPAAIPSSVSGNPVLQNQLLQMAKQINPNFNYNTALGAGAGQQSNAQVAGTAGVTANQGALGPAYQNYLSLQQTTQNIDGFGQLLTQTMQQGGINPSNVKYANAKLADIRNQLSSEQQAIYDNTLAGLRSRVSGLLAAGGAEIPTQITADANKILDGTLPLSALNGVLSRIQAEGNLLLSNAANVVNTAYSGTQNGGVGGGSTGNTGGGSGGLTWDSL